MFAWIDRMSGEVRTKRKLSPKSSGIPFRLTTFPISRNLHSSNRASVISFISLSGSQTCWINRIIIPYECLDPSHFTRYSVNLNQPFLHEQKTKLSNRPAPKFRQEATALRAANHESKNPVTRLNTNARATWRPVITITITTNKQRDVYASDPLERSRGCEDNNGRGFA